ncbi:MAG: glycerophosphoryl diester phosphodiesterase membrane domain-containing protein [Lysinibacillus sp.]
MERIKRLLGLVFRNIYYYRVDYIRTFVAVRLFQLFIVLPLVTLLFTFLLDALGIQSITEQNIWQLLAHPLVLTILTGILLVFLLFIYYEMGFLMLMAYHQQRAIPYTFLGLWKRLNGKVVHFVSFQTLLFAFYVLLALPLISSVLPLSITQHVQIPRFIVDELLASSKGRAVYYGALAVIFLVGLRFIFTLPFFTVYQWTTIWDAVKMSWQFSKRKLVETLAMLGLILGVHVTITTTVLAIAFLPLFLIERAFPDKALVVAAFTLTFVQGVLLVAFSLLQAVFSQILVLVSFKLTHEKPLISQNEPFRSTIRQWTVITAIFTYFLVSGFNILNLEKTVYEPSTKVIAHRGFKEEELENTISSLHAAVEAGADIVEIDVQETRDGEFVVFHDTDLIRLAGKNQKVYDMTQEELMEVEIWSKDKVGRIPSLEQMLEESRELDVQLLIEIKMHGYESEDMLERLIALLDEYEALDVHYIQSLSLPTTEKLKELEPRLKVGPVYALNFGDLPETDLDFISMEQYFATERIIEQAKEQDKPLFVWTVNDSRNLHRLLEQNVHGIITNDPDEASSQRDKFDKEKYFLHRVWNKIDTIF